MAKIHPIVGLRLPSILVTIKLNLIALQPGKKPIGTRYLRLNLDAPFFVNTGLTNPAVW